VWALTKVVHGRRALGGGYMGGCHTKWIMDIGGGHVGYAKISNQNYKKNYLKVYLMHFQPLQASNLLGK